MTGTKTNRIGFFTSVHSFFLRLFQGQNASKSDLELLDDDKGNNEIQNRIKALKEELQEIALERKKLEEIIVNCDWYSVNKTTESSKRIVQQFQSKDFGNVSSLMILKDDLLHRHELRVRKVEEQAIQLLSDIRKLLSVHQLSQAKNVFDELNLIISEVESKDIREAFKETILQWNSERKKLETDSIRKEASKNKTAHTEEISNAPQITNNQENEGSIEENHRQAIYDDLLERIRRNQTDEEMILKALSRIDHSKKKHYRAIESRLKKAGINYLYHYTDRRNLASINKHGGLLSLKFMSDNNIEVPAAIGDSTSHNIDKDLHTDDYVKLLSFVDYEAIKALNDDRDMVVLKIDHTVAEYKESLFTSKSLFYDGFQLSDDYRFLEGDLSQITFLVKTFVPKNMIVEVINCR